MNAFLFKGLSSNDIFFYEKQKFNIILRNCAMKVKGVNPT